MLTLQRFNDEAEAIEIANATPYGLAATSSPDPRAAPIG